VNGSDLKIFVPVIAIAVLGYLLLIPGSGSQKWGGKQPPKPVTPTITFVPKGTPGAITWEEYQKRRWGDVPRKR
jgi:hypothetical protein